VIDLHAHVLPGVDDGPTSLDGSLDLLRAAAADGVRVVAATPHLRYDHPRVIPEHLAAACRALTERLDKDGIALRVVAGGEVDLGWALDATDDQLRLVSFRQRGTDLLVETPYGPLSASFEEMLFRFALGGYRVTLAHPERNPTLQRDPERLEELVRRGVLVQLSAGPLLRGTRRSPSSRLAHRLLRGRLAHVLASDVHSAGPWRGPNLAAGAAAVNRLYPRLGGWMTGSAPAAILAGKPLPPLPPSA
jgi:protein-tyrosine phosphatase